MGEKSSHLKDRRNPGASSTGVGGGGVAVVRNLRTFENCRGRLPEMWIFQYLFSLNVYNVCIFQHFQNKVAEIQGGKEKLNFLG